MINKEDFYKCPLCNRYHKKCYMSFHHLLPTLDGIEKGEPRIYICQTCHNVIHFCHNNFELRFKYNSISTILSSKKIINIINIYKYKPDNCIFKIKKLKEKCKIVA